MELCSSTEDELLCKLRDAQDPEVRGRIFEELWRRCEGIVDSKLNELKSLGFIPTKIESERENFIKDVKQLVSLKLWKSARIYRGNYFDAFLNCIVKSCFLDLKKQIEKRKRHEINITELTELSKLTQGLERSEEELEEENLNRLAYRSLHYVEQYSVDPEKSLEKREMKCIVGKALAIYAQQGGKRNRNSAKAVIWYFWKGLTIEGIATRFGVTERTIYRWLSNHDLPGLKAILAERFGIGRLTDIC